MVRYRLAAAAALALAIAAPAAAKEPPGGAATICAVPAALSAPVMPLSPDSSLEDKIDQLTGVIADLSDRLAYLEDALDAPDDENGGDPDQALDMVHLRAAHHVGLAHRALGSVRAGQALAPSQGFAAGATPARQRTKVRGGTTT